VTASSSVTVSSRAATPAAVPLLVCERPRFSGSSVEFGEFQSSAQRLLLVGSWAPLFQLCAGSVNLQGGRLLILGHDAERAVADGQVGLSLADAPLPASWTLHEVLLQSGRLLGFSAREASDRARAWARDTGLEARLPKALGALGAAERRAAVLLAAVLGEPAVLVLEEPFASLEPSEQDFVARLLERLLLGRGGLIALREPPSERATAGWLRSEDEVLMLGPHGLSARGRRAELQANPSAYRVVVLREAEALSALLGAAGYRVLEGRAAGGLGLTVADPNRQGTRPLIAAALRADAPIVELGPVWPPAGFSSRPSPANADGGG
jgi:putative ABC transport system ATP-binding protein